MFFLRSLLKPAIMLVQVVRVVTDPVVKLLASPLDVLRPEVPGTGALNDEAVQTSVRNWGSNSTIVGPALSRLNSSIPAFGHYVITQLGGFGNSITSVRTRLALDHSYPVRIFSAAFGWTSGIWSILISFAIFKILFNRPSDQVALEIANMVARAIKVFRVSHIARASNFLRTDDVLYIFRAGRLSSVLRHDDQFFHHTTFSRRDCRLSNRLR